MTYFILFHLVTNNIKCTTLEAVVHFINCIGCCPMYFGEESPKLIDDQNWKLLTMDTMVYQSIKGPDLPASFTQYINPFQHGGEKCA